MERNSVTGQIKSSERFVTRVVSQPGAAMKVTVITAPDSVRKSISDGLDRGPEAAMKGDCDSPGQCA